MRTNRMERREFAKLIADSAYYRKISRVVAGGKILAVPLLALFLVPFLIETAQAFQLNRGNYRPAVAQPINRAPLNGINGSNFSTNRFNYSPTATRFVNLGVTQMNNKVYGTGNKSMNINALSGINRSNTFSTNVSNYADIVTRSVNHGLTQMNNKMYGTGNKGTNTTALGGNQTFKQNVWVPRNNATNSNPNLRRITGININNSSHRNVNTKLDFGTRVKKF